MFLGNLRALLWHHFNFYKRHIASLVWTILFPVLLIPSVVVCFAYVPQKLGTQQDIIACADPDQFPLFSTPSNLHSRTRTPASYINYYHDREHCKFTLGGARYGDGTQGEVHDLLNLHHILIYPKNRAVQKFITMMTTIISEILADCAGKTTAFCDVIKYKSDRRYIDRNTGGAASPRPSVASRFKTFETKDQLYAWWASNNPLSNPEPEYDPARPPTLKAGSDLLWAGIIFDSLGDETDYTVVSKNVRDADGVRTLLLQDLVDHAIIRMKTGKRIRDNTNIAYFPRQCQTRLTSFAYDHFQLLIVLTIFLCFLLPAINFLQQILLEKELRLDEYLEIMGVGGFELRISWILFHSIIILPLIVALTIVLELFPNQHSKGIDFGIWLMLLLLYNYSQIAWCCLLASLLQSSKRCGLIFGFSSLVLLVLGFLFVNVPERFEGPFLIIARVGYFHYVFPIIVALRVMFDWRKLWLPVRWGVAFYHPDPEIAFGGFGECLVIYIVQIIVYLVLAWYFDKIFGIDGIKRRPWFFFLPSYWRQRRAPSDQPTDETGQVIVKPVDGAEKIGIAIVSLRKVYGQHTALDAVNVSLYENQITVLLGQNGAGKSTMINCLIGLIHPTSGTAFICDLDIRSKMALIRQNIGFVPQHDILYPDITVQEHVHFYCLLRSSNVANAKQYTTKLLTQMDLQSRLKTQTTKLSGGQKRKLSILTAFIGNPKVIILDEPTAGVDPHSRRVIWDSILELKSDRTILLSTHHMEEADVLAERLVILNNGQLVTVGTPVELQERHKTGYKLHVAFNNPTCKQQIQLFIEGSNIGATLVQESEMALSYRLSKQSLYSPEMIIFLEQVEQYQMTFGITSIGISEPTSEEIFFAATGLNQLVNLTENQGGLDVNQLNLADDDAAIPALFCTQIGILFWKRVLQAFKSPGAVIIQIILPIVFVLAMCLILRDKQMFQSQGYTTTINLRHEFSESVFVIGNDGSSNYFTKYLASNGLSKSCKKQCKSGKKFPTVGTVPSAPTCKCNEECGLKKDPFKRLEFPDVDIIYNVGKQSIREWAIRLNQSDDEFLFLSGGLEISGTSRTLWLNPHRKEAVVNLYNNILFKRETGSDKVSITTRIEVNSMNRNYLQIIRQMFINYLVYGLLFFAYVFVALSIITYIQTENAFGIRNLQTMAGMNPFAYWIANFMFDMLIFLFVIATTLLLVRFLKDTLVSTTLYLFIVLFTYAFAQTGFNYLLSFCFATVSGTFKLHIILGIVCYVLSLVLTYLGIVIQYGCYTAISSNRGDAVAICIFMPVAVTQMIVAIIYPSYFLIDAILFLFLHEVNAKVLFFGESPFVFHYLGCRLAGCLLFGCLCYILTLVLQYKNVRRDCYCSKCCSAKLDRMDVNKLQRDPDVIMEEARVILGPPLDDPLIVKELSKQYRTENFMAVNKLTFAVKRGECFGLLGFNGAGKSTTFEILTCSQKPSNGDATLNQLNLRNDSRKSLKQMSYCPQVDALFRNMTVKEHLVFYCGLHGIQWSKQQGIISELVALAGLDPFMNKRACRLSGGNKRKLQLLIALLGKRDVIFLDEPTTGLDPGSKRKFWNLIKLIIKKRNCSIVLTSHSMDECEALCDRIGIMACGTFRCFGTLQHLKEKFGQSYTFKINVPNSTSNVAALDAKAIEPTPVATTADGIESKVVIEIEDFVRTYVPTSVLTEKYTTVLVYKISVVGLRLSQLFRVLHYGQKIGKYPSFSLSQVTLEEIFVGLARIQHVVEAGAKVVLAPDGTVCLLNDMSLVNKQAIKVVETKEVTTVYTAPQPQLPPPPPQPESQAPLTKEQNVDVVEINVVPQTIPPVEKSPAPADNDVMAKEVNRTDSKHSSKSKSLPIDELKEKETLVSGSVVAEDPFTDAATTRPAVDHSLTVEGALLTVDSRDPPVLDSLPADDPRVAKDANNADAQDRDTANKSISDVRVKKADSENSVSAEEAPILAKKPIKKKKKPKKVESLSD